MSEEYAHQSQLPPAANKFHKGSGATARALSMRTRHDHLPLRDVAAMNSPVDNTKLPK